MQKNLYNVVMCYSMFMYTCILYVKKKEESVYTCIYMYTCIYILSFVFCLYTCIYNYVHVHVCLAWTSVYLKGTIVCEYFFAIFATGRKKAKLSTRNYLI